MRAPRILYVWDADYPWDVRAEKICQALTSAGARVHLACRNRQWRGLLEQRPEALVHRLRPWRWAGRRLDGLLSFPAFFSPRWRGHLRRVAREAAIDLIIVRDLPLCPTAIHAARRHRIPVVLDMAEDYSALLRDVWATGRQQPFDFLIRHPRNATAVERWCLPRVDHVFTVVEESRDRLLRQGMKSERVEIVSNTPPLERTATTPPPAPVPGAALEVAYLGIMEIARGLVDLLEATAHLRNTSTPVHLHLVGDGRDLPLIRARALALGLAEPWVRFYGFIPSHADALGIVAGQQVGVLPHRVDGWSNTTIPNKLFDYMAAGLPVVSSDSAPCRRILDETGAGICYRGGDVTGLAAALAGMADPSVWCRHAAAGIAAIRGRYHWEVDAGTLWHRITALLAETPPPAARTRQADAAGPD